MKNKNKKKKFSKSSIVTGVAWYRSSQWDRLREVSEDSDKLENTYEEWLAMAEDFMKNFNTPGIKLVKVDIDVEELINWCSINNQPINSETRSDFTAQQIKKMT